MKRSDLRFRFIKTDKIDSYSDNKARPLVDFITKHVEFLQHTSVVLTTYLSPGSLDELDSRNRNKFQKYIQTLVFEEDDNYQYIDEFENIFRSMYDVSDCLEGTNDYNALGKIRGKVLELLIKELIYPRYKPTREDPYGKLFEVGCIVELNGKQLILEGRRVSVDIAAWDGIVGEFYEAKVGPQNFDDDVLQLLSLIKDELEKYDVCAVVGCITMVNKEKLIQQIESLKQDLKFKYNDNIVIIGKDELLSLKSHPIAA